MTFDSNLKSSRRNWLYSLVAGLALLLGSLAWHTLGSRRKLTKTEIDFWESAFINNLGERVLVKNFKGRPLILNFWATWCPPCIEELPLLDLFYQQNIAKRIQVLGLAVDQVSSVNKFLGQHPVSFPTALAGLKGMNLIRNLGNDKGVLPFTVVFDSEGYIRLHKIGRLTEADLRTWMLNNH